MYTKLESSKKHQQMAQSGWQQIFSSQVTDRIVMKNYIFFYTLLSISA